MPVISVNDLNPVERTYYDLVHSNIQATQARLSSLEAQQIEVNNQIIQAEASIAEGNIILENILSDSNGTSSSFNAAGSEI